MCIRDSSGSTTTSTLSGSSLSDTFSSWLVDASRKAGDCEVFETDTGAYVLQFQSRDDNNYNPVSYTHLDVYKRQKAIY